MAYYRKIDFARLCGTTPGNLANDVKDGKAQYTGKYVDDSLSINQAYISNREAILKNKDRKLDKTVKPIPLNQIKKADLNDPNPASVTEQAKIKMLKEKADLEKKQIAAKRAQLEYEKMIGSSIPTGLVTQLVALLGQTFVSSFNNAAKSLMDEFGHRKKLSAKDKAEMKGRLTEIINDAQSRSITEARMNLDNIIDKSKNG